MDIVVKHTNELLCAKSKFVTEMSDILNKMKQGDSDKCCFDGLFMKMKLIKRLDCYCFTPTPPNSVCYNCIDQKDLNKLYNILK